MRFNVIFIFLVLFISCSQLIGQNVGINTTTPEGTVHIKGASSIPHPNLRITDTADNFARIKMETTLGGNKFWDIAARPGYGLTQLNFYYQNDTIGENILQVLPELGRLDHRSITPSVRTFYYANRFDYQGVVGFNHEDLLLKSATNNGRVLLGTRNMNRMTLDTIGRIGLGTESPKYLADFRGSDDMLSGGELQLSTPSETNFLRFFGGRQGDPHPFIAFHESDTFHLVTTSADFSTYQRRMTMLPNGHIGLGTDKPIAELDIKTQDPDDGAALHLRNSDSTHFLRLFAGRQNLTTPIMYWNHGSAMEIGMTAFDDSDYRRFLSLDGQKIGVHNTGGSVFIGAGAGEMDDLSENRNVAIGTQAFHHNDTGYFNVVIGDSALHHAAGDSRQNVVIGALASQNAVEVLAITAIGFEALQNNQANANTALGFRSLRGHVSGNRNVAIGESAMISDTTGEDNTAVGSGSMFLNSSGYQNTAAGSFALFANKTGYRNVAIGYSALALDSTGLYNTVLGADAMSKTRNGDRNTIVGFGAGTDFFAPDKDWSEGNIFLGYRAGSEETGNNRLYIENSESTTPLIYGEFDNELIRINGKQEVTGELDIAKSGVALRIDGKEAIWSNSSYFSYGFGTGHNYFAKPLRIGPVEGSTTPFADLHVVDNSGDSNLAIESYSGDAILQLTGSTDNEDDDWTIRRAASDNDMEWRYNLVKKMELTDFGYLGLGVTNPTHLLQISADDAAKPGGGSWTNSSDRRLKRNIDSFEDGLTEIDKINPVTFQYNEKSGYDTTPEYVGVIAQELQKVAPYMVSQNEKGYLDVNNSAMTYMLVNAVKELKDENENLIARLDKQESMLQFLISQLDGSVIKSVNFKTKK